MRSMYTPKASAYMCVPDDSFIPVLVSRIVATSSACTVSCFNGQKIFQSERPNLPPAWVSMRHACIMQAVPNSRA